MRRPPSRLRLYGEVRGNSGQCEAIGKPEVARVEELLATRLRVEKL